MFRFVQHDKARSVEPPRIINIEDLRRAAKRRLPRVVFDYIDGGAEDERTLRANCHAFEEVTFRPRCAVATPACDLRVSVLGRSLSMPLILAPVGSSRLMYPAWRGSCCERRWRCGNCVCAFNALRLSLGRCCRRIEETTLVSALSRGWTRLRAFCHRTRESRWFFGAGCHNRHGGGRHAGTRSPKRCQGTSERTSDRGCRSLVSY